MEVATSFEQMIQDKLAVKGVVEKPVNLRNDERSLKDNCGSCKRGNVIFDTQNTCETNMLLVAVANLVTKWLGVRKPTAKRSDEPWWKRRIKQKIMQLRKDMSRLDRVSD